MSESRTLCGGGAAGAAMVGTAGIEVLQDVLAENQFTIQPLVPYLETMRWVLIVIVLFGIAVTIHARVRQLEAGAAGIGWPLINDQARRVAIKAYRLSLSDYRDRFVLKGGMLVTLSTTNSGSCTRNVRRSEFNARAPSE